MDYRNILYSTEGGIARLTLSRPDKLNSFTGEMHAELRDALDRIQADGSVRVLVLSGAGRAFCAGQDLADPAGASARPPPCAERREAAGLAGWAQSRGVAVAARPR